MGSTKQTKPMVGEQALSTHPVGHAETSGITGHASTYATHGDLGRVDPELLKPFSIKV